MKVTVFSIFFLVTLFAMTSQARVTTLRKGLSAVQDVAVIDEACDSASTVETGKFVEGTVTMKGFAKKASDAKETFFLTNHSSQHISMVEVKLRYSDMKGTALHERTVQVRCDLPAYSTRQASVKTFDTGREFYYYMSAKPRKQAQPFQVSVKFLRYDVVCEK